MRKRKGDYYDHPKEPPHVRHVRKAVEYFASIEYSMEAVVVTTAWLLAEDQWHKHQAMSPWD